MDRVDDTLMTASEITQALSATEDAGMDDADLLSAFKALETEVEEEEKEQQQQQQAHSDTLPAPTTTATTSTTAGDTNRSGTAHVTASSGPEHPGSPTVNVNVTIEHASSPLGYQYKPRSQQTQASGNKRSHLRPTPDPGGPK
eukprot:TRINITY_DN40212_c0_g1_i1.p1 TRINITY_DN40212_c0_g1~~TRINITY_DN40212_c0_g1_i1.p1  ORF type:complete len:143 (-),score=33.75 TRINITY_DN40212_c0_g1_i1:9-437(-)